MLYPSSFTLMSYLDDNTARRHEMFSNNLTTGIMDVGVDVLVIARESL